MLEQTLIHFAERMNKAHPMMNYGGCAVFAVHMAKRLQHVVPTRIKLFSWDKHDLNAIRAKLNDPLDIDQWYPHVHSFSHVIVEFDLNDKTYHYDSEGLREAQDSWCGNELSDGEFTVEEMSSFAGAPNQWNTTFNRARIPQVKRQIKNLFARQIYANQLTKYQQAKKEEVAC